jgi:lipoprotein-anchoring transpeptidase ErfK/SrfK
MLRLTPKIITIDRSRFILVLWRMKGNHYIRAHRYSIAVGAIGHTTPTGMYFVSARSRTPDWRAPDWAPEEIAGTVLPYEDPRNPFYGGFIALGGNHKEAAEGVGIHGVKFDPQLGSRASHGCIRMDDAGILDLYDRADIGTPTFIH